MHKYINVQGHFYCLCVYGFRFDYFVLVNQLKGSSLSQLSESVYRSVFKVGVGFHMISHLLRYHVY